MTFRAWLMKQRKRQDPVGDLARDAAVDENLRRVRLTPAKLKELVELGDACDGAIDAVNRAGKEYAASLTAAQPAR